MKKGFTLAEVLITLAIIGVVAALTIPTVMANYQKQALYTQFMKAYNTLSKVFQLSMADYGGPGSWDCSLNKQQFLETYMAPYIKNQGYKPSFGVPGDTPVKTLSGESMGTASSLQGSMPDSLILDDGGSISVYSFNCLSNGSKYAELFYETNGVKGPNTWGRDIFYLQYGYDSVNNKNGIFIYFGFSSEGDIEQFCNPKGSSTGSRYQGETCAIRLLKEGKMNY